MTGTNRTRWAAMTAVVAAIIGMGAWAGLGYATEAEEPEAAPGVVRVWNSGNPGEASVSWDGTEGAAGYSIRWVHQDAARDARYASQDWEDLILSVDIPAGVTGVTLKLSDPATGTAGHLISVGSRHADGGQTSWSEWQLLDVTGAPSPEMQIASAALAISRLSTELALDPGPTTREMTEQDLQGYGEAAVRNTASLAAQVVLLGGNAHPDRISNIEGLTGRLSSNVERIEGGRAAVLEAMEAWDRSEWQLIGVNSRVLFRTAATVTDLQFHRLMGAGNAGSATPDRVDALRYSHWTNLSSDLMLAHALLDMSSLLDDPKRLARVREEYDSAADRIRQDIEFLTDNSITQLELDLLELAGPILRAGSGDNNYFDLLERMLELQAAEESLLDDSVEALKRLTDELEALVDNPRSKPASGTAPAAEGTDPGITAGEVLFGQSAALTRPSGALGRGMKLGIETAFAEANRDGGVHGRELTLVSLNDRYEPDSAAAATEYLVDDRQVFALIGAVGTPTSRAAVPLAEAAGTPFIGPFTGAQFLRNPELENVINVRASYHQETEEMVERLTRDLGITRVAVLYQNDSYGVDGLEGARMALERRGLEPAATWYYHRNTEAVLSAAMRIAEAEPEAVIIIGAYGPTARAIEVLKEEMDPDPVFAAVSFVGSVALADRLGDQGEGVYVTQVVSLPRGETALAEQYRTALEAHSPGAEPSFVSLEGYLAGRLAVAGLEACGPEPTRQCFLDAVRDPEIVDISDFMLDYGPDDNQGSDAVFVTEIDAEGQFRLVEQLTR